MTDISLRGVLIRAVPSNPTGLLLFNTFLVPGGLGDPANARQAAITEVGQSFHDTLRGLTLSLVDIGTDRAVVRAIGAPDTRPLVTAINYGGGKKLVIVGSRFRIAAAPRVLINGKELSGLVKSWSEKKIKIKGSKDALGLHPGQNTIQVTTSDGTLVSEIFFFSV